MLRHCGTRIADGAQTDKTMQLIYVDFTVPDHMLIPLFFSTLHAVRAPVLCLQPVAVKHCRLPACVIGFVKMRYFSRSGKATVGYGIMCRRGVEPQGLKSTKMTFCGHLVVQPWMKVQPASIPMLESLSPFRLKLKLPFLECQQQAGVRSCMAIARDCRREQNLVRYKRGGSAFTQLPVISW